MKNIFLLLLFSVLLSSNTNAQTIAWQKTYTNASEGRSVKTLSDGGYIAVGGYKVGVLLRTNASGDSLWSKSFGDANSAVTFTNMQILSDGFIISGSKDSCPYVVKTDKNGTMVWEHFFGSKKSYGEINSCIPVSNGIVFTGYIYVGAEYYLTISKLSLTGDSLWTTSITPHTTTDGRAVSSTSGNSILNIGTSFVITGTADKEIYSIKVDASGNRIWDRCYGGKHNMYLNDEGKCIRSTPDGGYIICGGKATSITAFETEISLIKITSDGSLEWQKVIPGEGGYGFELLVENDSYIVVGYMGRKSSFGHIIKTNLQGDVSFDTELGGSYAFGLVKGVDGSYTVIGIGPSSYGMYLANIRTPQAPRYFTILDAKNNPIKNKQVTFYKGTMKPGNDERIIRQKTDENGKIEIDPTWYEFGDNIRASIDVITIPTQKLFHHDSILQGVAYRVTLDNIKFDEQNSLPATNIRFNEYKSDPKVLDQTLVLDHTTILFDLLVSIEWDAKKDYTDEMEKGFLLVSNYLYDVFDGQVALGKVSIVDEKTNWNGADICVTASTETHPNAGIKGYLNANIGNGNQVFMPPRWIGDVPLVRESLVKNNWLSICTSDHWRMLAHELGHQLLGFRDEYSSIFTINIDSLKGYKNLGYMDSQYSGDTLKNYKTLLDRIYSSELSTAERYGKFKSNIQFLYNSMDCWSYFEKQFENTYDGVFCPIIKPSERTLLANGAITLQGPNDNNYITPAYDISSVMKIYVSNKNINLRDIIYTLSLQTKPTPTPANLIRTYLFKKTSNQTIDLGLTNNDGRIRFFGAENGDKYLFSGTFGKKNSGTAISLPGVVSVGKAPGEIIASSDTSVMLSLASGEFRIVPMVQYSTKGITLDLKTTKAFKQNPTIELAYDNGTSVSSLYIYTSANTTYSVSLDSINHQGTMFSTCYDDASSPFILPFNYSTSTFSNSMSGDNGNVLLYLDSTNESTIQKATFLSSSFSTILNGLAPNAEQAGNICTFATYPNSTTLSGTNSLTIRYSKSDLQSQSEASLQVFHWNPTLTAWENIGGSVDTVHQEVSAQITSAGTYALFTTNSTSGMNEEDANDSGIMLTATQNNSSLNVSLTLSHADNVTLTISNNVGASILQISSGQLQAGTHEFTNSIAALASGVYYCTVKTATSTKTTTFTIVK